jgi:hypothetical protein
MIPTPRETRTRRVIIARLSATIGGKSDKGDDAKSIKFMIFKNQLVKMARDLLQKKSREFFSS